ncbi:MAG: glycosyltransferase [Candidatus Thorarchaeota archaeon]
MEKKITIIIPFLNEGEELLYTIKSIYETASPKLFEIIVVNDASTIQSTGLEKYEEITIIRNRERLGVDASRDKAVKLAKTYHVFIIDAHMRFKNDKWCKKIIKALNKEPTTIFCTCSVALNHSKPEVTVYNAKRGRYYGANLLLYNHNGIEQGKPSSYRDIIVPKWRKGKKKTGKRIYEIPCILGATYGINRKWFNKLKGFEGLKMWGSSEPFISLKSWLAGGKCKIISDVEIGHYYRNKSPYTTESYYLLYNKMFIAKTIFSKNLASDMISYLGNNRDVRMAKNLIDVNRNLINDYREYFKALFTKSIFNLCKKFNINHNWPENIPYHQ